MPFEEIISKTKQQAKI